MNRPRREGRQQSVSEETALGLAPSSPSPTSGGNDDARGGAGVVNGAGAVGFAGGMGAESAHAGGASGTGAAVGMIPRPQGGYVPHAGAAATTVNDTEATAAPGTVGSESAPGSAAQAPTPAVRGARQAVRAQGAEQPGPGRAAVPAQSAAGSAESSASAAQAPAAAPGPVSTRPAGTEPAPAKPNTAGKGRRTRVRSRLIVAVAVVAAATAGASAPALVAACGEVSDSQTLVTDAERTRQALSLAHALADERDEATAYVAAGRPKGGAPTAQDHTAVDRGIAELRTEAPAGLRHDLDGVAAVRKAALTGKSSALHTHEAYAAVILSLHRLAEDLADRTPPRAGTGAQALADLDRAVEQAEATRGLLLAALAVPGGTTTVIDPITGLPQSVPDDSSAEAARRAELSGAAQRARLREQAALADFRDRAPAAYRTAYDSTVTGPDVGKAESDLARLTDQPTLSGDDRDTDAGKLGNALTSRVDTMRGAEASLNATRAKELAVLRDDDVTALEIRAALAGICLLAAVGVTMGMARGLTRPLAVLRIGSARIAGDPAAEEPIRFTGRNDEFAQVVRSVNALHAHALGLHRRLRESAGAAAAGPAAAEGRFISGPGDATAQPVGARVDGTGTDGVPVDAAAGRAAVRSALDAAAAGLDQARRAPGTGQDTFVHLALRTLGLVERQLAVIEKLEEQEHDPDRLATLFRLDHFATLMRRHSENLLVLAGADHGPQHLGAVSLVDVVRAAVSETERYERVRITSLPAHAHVVGFAADDLSHLLAELMENATACSPPDAPVEVSGWLLESGELMLSVVDEGIGMSPERLDEANARLARTTAGEEPAPAKAFGAARDRTAEDGTHARGSHADGTPAEAEAGGSGLGLYVVARLAARHGVQVRLQEQQHGGVAAVVVLPVQTLAEAGAGMAEPPREVRLVGAAAAARLPGAVAEANSNVLPGRGAGATPGADPLIAAAEAALRAAAVDPDGEPGSAEAHDRATGSAPAPVQGPFSADLPGSADEPAQVQEPAPNPYAIGPDTHERTSDAAVGRPTSLPGGPSRSSGTDGTWERVTDKGLPKRTPKASPVREGSAARPGAVDATELRRRLGAFQQGARNGLRDAEADLADDRNATRGQQRGTARGTGHHTSASAAQPPAQVKGDTVEEASS